MRKLTVATIAVFLVFSASMAGRVRQMTDSKDVSYDWPMPIGDGSEIIIATSTDQYSGGGNPQHRFQIASFDPLTGTATQLTSFPASLTHLRHNVSVTDDGQWLAFISGGDLIPGQNGERNDQAFAMKRDGTNMVQLTHISGPNSGSVTRIAMSGASNRIAFVSSANITGGNPQRAQQVYVVDRDGSNMIQLTHAPTGSINHMWISDDGTRLAFNHTGDLTGGNADHNEEVFAITVGDASPRQITSSTVGGSDSANISGDGNTIVFESTANYTGGNADGGDEIFKADFTTGTITQLTSIPTAARTSRQPWPTNNGSVIFFSSNRFNANSFEIWKINSDGTGLTRLTDLNLDCEHPVAAGDGSRYATWLEGGLYTGTTFGTEVPIIVRDIPLQGDAEISGNGQKVLYTSPSDPLGQNPDHVGQVFVSGIDGSGLHQLSSVPLGGFGGRPAIDGAGTRAYFESTQAPSGKNEIFGINTDGTGLMQYTTCNQGGNVFSGYTDVSDDGNTIAFVSLCDLTGTNPGGSRAPLFAVNKDGTNLRQLTSFSPVANLTTYNYWPKLDATGTWVTMTGNANINGGNPNNNYQVWRMKMDGTNLQQLTADPVYRSFNSDISGDGSKIAFDSDADLTGQNADHNREIFLWQPAAVPQMRQLTVTTKVSNELPRFSRDGRYVYFQSTNEFLENDPDHAFFALYRYELTTDTIRRSGGLRSENLNDGWPASVNDDGSVVAYVTFSDSVGKNPDEYWEIIVADYNAQNPPVVSPHAAPTTITFEPEPGLVRYDVIRGSLSSLHTAGSTVDLGAVTCVENDSGDTTTAGYPDIDTPSPGQGFFYVFRGAMSIATGPGSYGTSHTGNERVASSGDCSAP